MSIFLSDKHSIETSFSISGPSNTVIQDSAFDSARQFVFTTPSGKKIIFINANMVDRLVDKILESGCPLCKELELLIKEYQIARNGGEVK